MSEIQIRSAIEKLPTYKAGAVAPDVAGLIPYKLSSNENPFNPLPSVVEAMMQAAKTVNRYPDPFVSELTSRIAQMCEVPPAMVATGTGSVGVCQQIVQALCDAQDEVIFAWRSFEAYPIIVSIAGAQGVQIALNEQGEHDLGAMLAAVSDVTKVIFICTPNNPTGRIVRHRDLLEFLNQLPKHILVVVDEAYIEFNRDAEAVDGLALVKQFSNVGLLRTFSKAYGLAGLRVGYFVGPENVAEAVRKTAVPFGVSQIAQVAAVASLDHQNELFTRVQELVELREWFEAELNSIGFVLPKSQANFVWIPLGARTLEFSQACNAKALAVRAFPNEGVRISIGERDALERTLEVLKDFVA